MQYLRQLYIYFIIIGRLCPAMYKTMEILCHAMCETSIVVVGK